jgi:muconolactone D-isomerase
MLFLVHMVVTPPTHLTDADFDTLKKKEKQYALGFQEQGVWLHLWRIVGEYANYSVFSVASNDQLHDILSKLPLFPYMRIKVTPLAQHPSAIAFDERKS